MINYIGNYDYYLEKREELAKIYLSDEPKHEKADSGKTEVKMDWQEQKAKQAQIRKIENALKKAEEEIERLETRIAEIDEECALPENATNSAKLGDLVKEQEACNNRLEELYEEWENLSVQL